MALPPKQTPGAGPSLPRYVSFDRDRPSALVVGHERSGNHFLMNTLARAYGYVANPWFNIDLFPHPINYFHPGTLERLLMDAGARRMANVGKSHHAAEFFDSILKNLQKRYVIFYIHRDPVDVMLSYWRIIDHWPWREGPRRNDPADFALAEPEGQMLRYQMRQRRNLLDRWAAHVEGWTEAAKNQHRVVIVRYSDLKDRYAATVERFADALHESPRNLTPPSRNENVITGSDLPVSEQSKASLRRAAIAEVGTTC
jgi:hypothetical protein